MARLTGLTLGPIGAEWENTKREEEGISLFLTFLSDKNLIRMRWDRRRAYYDLWGDVNCCKLSAEDLIETAIQTAKEGIVYSNKILSESANAEEDDF